MTDETREQPNESASPDLRAVLDDVAAGRISAEKASRLIASTSTVGREAAAGRTEEAAGRADQADTGEREGAGRADEAAGRADQADTGEREASGRADEAIDRRDDAAAKSDRSAPSTGSPAGQPTKLRVRAVGRRVRIVGEPFLSAVAVEGPHVMKVDGDTLTVASEGEFAPSLDNFTLRTPSLRDLQERFVDLTRELVIRANPKLDLEIEVTAGSVSTERVPNVRHLRITAGSAKLRDLHGPVDLLVQGGSATVEGPISKGVSKLRVESGSLNVNLLNGSDVTVTQDVQLGRVTWGGDSSPADQHVVGAGTAELRLEALMGNIAVREA